MNTTLIHIDNLSFGYRRKAPLFSQFNLDIPTGEIIGLLGKKSSVCWERTEPENPLYYILSADCSGRNRVPSPCKVQT